MPTLTRLPLPLAGLAAIACALLIAATPATRHADAAPAPATSSSTGDDTPWTLPETPPRCTRLEAESGDELEIDLEAEGRRAGALDDGDEAEAQGREDGGRWDRRRRRLTWTDEETALPGLPRRPS